MDKRTKKGEYDLSPYRIHQFLLDSTIDLILGVLFRLPIPLIKLWPVHRSGTLRRNCHIPCKHQRQ